MGQTTNADVQLLALTLLAKLTQGSELLVKEIDDLKSGGIPTLFRLGTQGNDNRVKGAACRVLGACCSGDYMSACMCFSFFLFFFYYALEPDDSFYAQTCKTSLLLHTFKILSLCSTAMTRTSALELPTPLPTLLITTVRLTLPHSLEAPLLIIRVLQGATRRF